MTEAASEACRQTGRILTYLLINMHWDARRQGSRETKRQLWEKGVGEEGRG